MAINNGLDDKQIETAIEGDPEFEKRVANILDKKHRWRWRLLMAWVIAFTLAAVFLSLANRHRAAENRNRIHDIQASRLASCKDNYEAFNKVFRPFFPKHQKDFTPEQRHRFHLLHQVVAHLKKQCVQQIKPR